MSKMKSMLSMYALMAISANTDNPNSVNNYLHTEETEEERNKRLALKKVEQNIAHGLKEFSYGENKVYAINQKVADKKAKKNNYI